MVWAAKVSQSGNCGMKENYEVRPFEWTYNIGTRAMWRYAGLKVMNWRRRGRGPYKQTKNHLTCSTTVTWNERNHWIQCESYIWGKTKHGFVIPRSEGCQNAYLESCDGDCTKSEGRNRACGHSKTVKWSTISSGNSIQLRYHSGYMSSSHFRNGQTIYAGFNVRCTAIKWATWFGAASKSLQPQCQGKSEQKCAEIIAKKDAEKEDLANDQLPKALVEANQTATAKAERQGLRGLSNALTDAEYCAQAFAKGFNYVEEFPEIDCTEFMDDVGH